MVRAAIHLSGKVIAVEPIDSPTFDGEHGALAAARRASDDDHPRGFTQCESSAKVGFGVHHVGWSDGLQLIALRIHETHLAKASKVVQDLFLSSVEQNLVKAIDRMFITQIESFNVQRRVRDLVCHNSSVRPK